MDILRNLRQSGRLLFFRSKQLQNLGGLSKILVLVHAHHRSILAYGNHKEPRTEETTISKALGPLVRALVIGQTSHMPSQPQGCPESLVSNTNNTTTYFQNNFSITVPSITNVTCQTFEKLQTIPKCKITCKSSNLK